MKTFNLTPEEAKQNNKLTFSELVQKYGYTVLKGRFSVSGVKMPLAIKGNGIEAYFADKFECFRFFNSVGLTALNLPPKRKGVRSFIKNI